MSGLDHLMGRRPRGDEYNCAHFAAEVWLSETGEEIEHLLVPLVRGVDRASSRPLAELFERGLRHPPRGQRALVMMRRRRSPAHLGVLVRGRLIHLLQSGPEALPPTVAARGFDRISYHTRRAP